MKVEIDKIKIFVFTYDRYDSLTTPMYLDQEGINHIVLCHTEEQKAELIKAGRVDPKKIVVSGNPKGLTYNRNFALSMLEKGEWGIFFCDDMNKIFEFDDYNNFKGTHLPIDIKNIGAWNKRFDKVVSIRRFLEVAAESIEMAERFNINLVGFAGFNNPLFLKDKWKFNALADGRAWCVKKTDLKFDENVQMVDDVNWTALNIKYSGVLINQWIIPDFKRYTKGAFGSISQRLEQRKSECAYLVKTYPNLIKFAKKKGWPWGTHIQIVAGALKYMKRNPNFCAYLKFNKKK